MKAIFYKLLRLFGLRKRRTVIIGLGEFDAGPTDLATNKKYMEGFGK
jgi:hypothetical protein